MSAVWVYPARVRVVNLASEAEMVFVGIPPEEAVVAAYAHARGDHNTWGYREKYGSLVTVGDKSVACGDWCALLTVAS